MGGVTGKERDGKGEMAHLSVPERQECVQLLCSDAASFSSILVEAGIDHCPMLWYRVEEFAACVSGGCKGVYFSACLGHTPGRARSSSASTTNLTQLVQCNLSKQISDNVQNTVSCEHIVISLCPTLQTRKMPGSRSQPCPLASITSRAMTGFH